jgi:type VI protein secretion system component VasK
MLIAIVAYEINFWIARLTLERTAYEHLTRPADAIVTLLIVFGVWGILFWPGTRRAFQALDHAISIDTQQPANSHPAHG